MPEFAPVTSAFWPLSTLLIGQNGITASGRFSSRRCCCIRSSCSVGICVIIRLGGSLISVIIIALSEFVLVHHVCGVRIGREKRAGLTVFRRRETHPWLDAARFHCKVFLNSPTQVRPIRSTERRAAVVDEDNSYRERRRTVRRQREALPSGALGGRAWRLPLQVCARPPARSLEGGGRGAGNVLGGAQGRKQIRRAQRGEELARRDSEKQDQRPLPQGEPRDPFHQPGILPRRGERKFSF